MSVVFVLHSQVARALRSSILLATAPHSQPVVASSSPSSDAAHSETKLCKQKEAFAGVFRFDIVALGPTTLCHLSQRPQFDCCVWLTESWVAQFPTISYYLTLSLLYTIYTDIYYILYSVVSCLSCEWNCLNQCVPLPFSLAGSTAAGRRGTQPSPVTPPHGFLWNLTK